MTQEEKDKILSEGLKRLGDYGINPNMSKLAFDCEEDDYKNGMPNFSKKFAPLPQNPPSKPKPQTQPQPSKAPPPQKSRRACRQARLSSKKGATRTISREVPPAPTHQPPQGGLCIRRNAQELRLGRSQNRRTWGDNLGLCGASTQRASRAVQRGCRSMKETLMPCVLSTQSPSEYLHSMGASVQIRDIPSFFGSKVCLCTTNCHLSYKDPCPDRGINHSKVVIKEQRNQ